MAIISVFGATGFVGQSLIYQLAQNAHEIYVLTRNLPKAQKLLPAGLPGKFVYMNIIRNHKRIYLRL